MIVAIGVLCTCSALARDALPTERSLLVPLRTSLAEQVSSVFVEFDFVFDPLVAFGIGDDSDSSEVFADLQVSRLRLFGGYSAAGLRGGWLRPVAGQE